MRALPADGKLREREFQFHPVCYRDYTKNFRYDENAVEEEEVNERFSKVIEFVKSIIIEYGRTCSVEVLVGVFCEDSTDQKQRAHLKDNHRKEFFGELLFLNVIHHSS